MMDMLQFALGAAVVAAIWLARRRITDFPAQKPSDYADDYTVFDMRKHLDGAMVCEGVIFGPAGRVTSSFVADFNVTWDGDTACIEEHFVYDDNTTQDRTWTITLGETGHFTATAPDVKGTAKGRNVGATVQSKYTIRLPDDVGGHLLNTVDWMYLTGHGTIINRSQFRKFGVKVAELVATIRRKDAA